MTQERLDLKEQLVIPVSQATEDLRGPVASLASKGPLAHPAPAACRETGGHPECVAPRAQRVKNPVISTLDKSACASCKSNWPSWLPV